MIDLPVLLGAGLLASGSPGPATLGIANASMASGRRHGLAFAAGITTGSLIWSITAASGFAALMMANLWLLELLRYFGGAYLLYLAFRSAQAAFKAEPGGAVSGARYSSLRQAYSRGLALHLTNPKPILFFASLYSLGVPAQASPAELVTVILALGLQSALLFHAYALMFSSAWIARGYVRLRRWFETAFALAFGFAGLKILTARI